MQIWWLQGSTSYCVYKAGEELPMERPKHTDTKLRDTF